MGLRAALLAGVRPQRPAGRPAAADPGAGRIRAGGNRLPQGDLVGAGCFRSDPDRQPAPRVHPPVAGEGRRCPFRKQGTSDACHRHGVRRQGHRPAGGSGVDDRPPCPEGVRALQPAGRAVRAPCEVGDRRRFGVFDHVLRPARHGVCAEGMPRRGWRGPGPGRPAPQPEPSGRPQHLPDLRQRRAGSCASPERTAHRLPVIQRRGRAGKELLAGRRRQRREHGYDGVQLRRKSADHRDHRNAGGAGYPKGPRPGGHPRA